MTAFWKNLHRLAQGQLFNGGYLVEPPPSATSTARDATQDARRKARKLDTRRRLPHLQIAGYR